MLGTLKIGDVLETSSDQIEITKIEDVGLQDVYTPLAMKNIEHSYLANDINSKNCSFLGSSNTLIQGEFLDQLHSCDPKDFKYNYAMRIWEEPKNGILYVMGVDTARRYRRRLFIYSGN